MSETKPLAVIILAAGSIKNKYQSYSFVYNSPALVPIASRSTLSFIISFYDEQNEHIYLAINEEDLNLFRNELVYYDNITIVPIKHSTGVCDTLKQVLDNVSEDEVIINLGTTIPCNYPVSGSVQYDAKLSTHSLYSGFFFENNNIIFKGKNNSDTQTFYAFTGVLRNAKTNLIVALGSILDNTDLLNVVVALHQSSPLHFQASEWIDTGHEINYADARKKLISSRSFNSISVNNHTGILTKKSSNKLKLLQEISYVGMLPLELQILYPRILSSDNELGFVKMEYYGYPNLSEYQLYRALEPLQWHRIFESLLFSLTAMKSHSFSIGPKAFENFYLQKTLSRIKTYLTSLPDEDLFNKAEQIQINGVICSNVSNIQSQIEKRIKGIYNEADFCVMHGDFCFNNILFDIVSDTIKLIDPRGSFGENCIGIYGDIKYDLAKLLHSTIGHYDYIVNNLFRLEISNTIATYSFPLRDNQDTLQKLSEELLEKMSVNKKDVLFIVGLLFLSMCPLHTDNPQRQKLMYLHGLSFVNKHL